MRHVVEYERRALCGARFAMSVILIVSASAAVHAQRRDIECDPSIAATATRDKLGYQKRSYGCEGTYVGLQSALHGVHVVSFVRGAIRYDREKHDFLRVALAVKPGGVKLKSPIRIVGRPRRANLHWAFDAQLEETDTLQWDLNTVVNVVPLPSDAVGMYGVTQRADGLGGPIYVPLQVGSATKGDSLLQLIVRVPAAGEVCWKQVEKNESEIPSRLGMCPELQRADRINADGFFEILLPLSRKDSTSSMSERRLLLHWRPRSQRAAGLGGPVYLSYLSW